MSKHILFQTEEREKLLKGVKTLSKAVSATMGAKGRNVSIERGENQTPLIVHDGVTVAENIFLKDKHENMGAQLLKQAAKRTNDTAGDGTTTATLLAEVIATEGDKYIRNGEDPMTLRDEITNLSKAIILRLKENAIKVTTKKQIKEIATVSSVSDEIGEIIAEAIDKVGKHGLVVVEEGQETKIEVVYKEGMEFDNGYISPYFVTNPSKMISEIKDSYVLVTDKKITAMDEDFIAFLNNFVSNSGQNKALTIIADEVSGEALVGLIVNKIRGVLINILAVKAPAYGSYRKDMLEDIAILTGANLISEDEARTFESIQIDDLGKADKVESDVDTTKIIGGKGSLKKVKERIANIEKQIGKSKNQYANEKLQERLAKLTGGVAVINVGATTEVELKEVKERVIDAVGAAQSAVEEGIIPGGGIELLKIAQTLGVEYTKDKIIRKALKAPFLKILENAGYQGSVELIENHVGDFGYNVLTKEYGSMVKMGIIDPVKVTRLALENAVSVATMILTTEVGITQEDKNE